MEHYRDIRRALEQQPSTWRLLDNVVDEDPIPKFPATALDIPQVTDPPTSMEVIKNMIVEQSSSDPSVLRIAVDRAILTMEEAQNLLRTTWGREFLLEDFMPDEGNR